MELSKLRVLDTGVHHGRYNIALDSALIEARRLGISQDTLRFLEFSPSALVGRHQDLSREINVNYCLEHAIDIGRRLTGGGAIYLDREQLGWELICNRKKFGGEKLEEIASVICGAVVNGLSQLGVKANFRGRNDIEIEGRKISGTGGFFDGDTLFYQGTILLNLDAEKMFRVLRTPDQKHLRHGVELSAARVTSLKDIFKSDAPTLNDLKAAIRDGVCHSLGFSYHRDSLSSFETSTASDVYKKEVGQNAFIYSIDNTPIKGDWSVTCRSTSGGNLSVYVKIEKYGLPRIASIILAGDFFITPPRLVYDLECWLKQVPIDAVGKSVAEFFKHNPVDIMSVPVDVLQQTIEEAVS